MAKREFSAENKPVPEITAQEIVDLRQKLHLSQCRFGAETTPESRDSEKLGTK